jgi:hypothetical protein
MTNADATARVLSGLAALGSLVVIVSTARTMSKPGPRPDGLFAYLILSFGILVYGTGRVLSGPEGRDLSVDIVGGALITCGTIGIVIAKRAVRKREVEVDLLEK